MLFTGVRDRYTDEYNRMLDCIYHSCGKQERSIVFITGMFSRPQAHLAVHSESGFAEMSKLEANADGVVTIVSLSDCCF